MAGRVAVDDVAVRADDLISEILRRGAVEEVVKKGAAETDAVTVAGMNATVRGGHEIGETTALLGGVGVIDVDSHELGEEVNIGTRAGLPATPAAIAEENNTGTEVFHGIDLVTDFDEEL